jgi:hypothetical protein
VRRLDSQFLIKIVKTTGLDQELDPASIPVLISSPRRNICILQVFANAKGGSIDIQDYLVRN